ncbi:CBS domain-containing protein [Granulibacter bethesdensis]|uniref:CBS domain containing protein n=2 Tax=Granulibacter bethesdensis TaxID=364410 RepID=Q0BSF2_GRABC|nr:CBS domain-containing protein [Granulibacter bethesdensis]ABI62250.1 CBS domain containing protein [Granulibacter bethesdensis CGDNIH1]AHJ63162.1 CBS domain containing protein [Granulibacter bethesdensis]AHJ68843.1 CBS domain containing protein [Granulibacter bethesdensis]APH52076.1 CBS domain containing protein [Granulibacter bethesdensis]APH64767.1 CBS domain containing protein [Granulibacter bethesdensis]
MLIGTILKNKGHAVETVGAKAEFAAIAVLLSDKRIGAVPVLGAEGEIRGIVSERDLVRAMANYGVKALELTAEQMMTRGIRTASAEMTVEAAMETMTTGRFRHLPVVEEGRLIGIVSIGDVVAARINQQEHEVDSLRAYVAGSV